MEDSDQLIQQAATGDSSARVRLLTLHRDRLSRMVALRMDPRLSARFDPSDVVQEALVTAEARLDSYLEARPVAFYPWLRKIAWERLMKFHETHVQTQKRTVIREVPEELGLSHESVNVLVGRLADGMPTPSENMVRSEMRRRIQGALAALRPRDREIVELLYLEQLKTEEIADVLEISSGSVRARHFRAIQRLTQLLKESEH